LSDLSVDQLTLNLRWLVEQRAEQSKRRRRREDEDDDDDDAWVDVGGDGAMMSGREGGSRCVGVRG
jgi:hypothetical protein